MITETMRRQIELALWPNGDSTPGSLWAILDCARDRRIYHELTASRVDHQCLYSGSLPTEIKWVAPYMVELNPRGRFTRMLLEQGWGRSWGIFVRVNDWTRLRHHLRKLLTVQFEDGRKLLFRFYDPRVLRVFLPTCTRGELEQVFGPVAAYHAESPAGQPGVVSFAFDGERLGQRKVDLSAAA
jgi:hypothetical protein